MKLKKILIAALVAVAGLALVSCGQKKEQSDVQKIIAQAQTMSFNELCAKAIEESNGKVFYGVGNSSRGKKALPMFITYLQTINADYKMSFEWQQPKNNKIFDQLTADSKKASGTFAMTLIQDGNQIESKMVQTGVLDTFIPKEWAAANKTTASAYKGYLALQTLNKVFMYNSTGDKVYDNVWDFVAPDQHTLFMDIDSEIVGKNFLYMLTKDEYAADLKAAYDALPAAEQATYKTTIDALAQDATDLGLGANGKYALAWIKLWVNQYQADTDDDPICKTLCNTSATDKAGLLVYSKLRSIEETDVMSKNNIKVAAYQTGYQGAGGYGYCHYLFVTDNSPLPWTACAFIAYMTIINESANDELATKLGCKTVDEAKVAGFSAWGADMGGYSSNPDLLALNEQVYKHSTGGYVDGVSTYEAKNDKGLEWWTTTGKLVVEDPTYCASVAFTVGSWIELLDKYTAK